MRYHVSTIAIAIAVVGSIFAAIPSAVAVNCDDWDTVGYFGRVAANEVTECLDAGADVNARDERGRTPLHWAAHYTETPAVIATLLDAGADAKAKDFRGSTPWDLAKDNDKLKGTDAYWRLNGARF